MNFAHLHLLLNHFPIIGTIVGLGMFLTSLRGKNEDVRLASLIIFPAMALLAIIAFFSGVGAQGAIRKAPDISEALIERHQGAAMLAMLFMETTGALSLVALWRAQGKQRPARWDWSLSAVLLFSIMTAGLMARVGTTGGDIRHPETVSRQEEVADASGISKIVRAFEPSPGRVAELMTTSKCWWAFMMDMPFVGLALLLGAVGILDLRMLGFPTQIPIHSFHRL